MEPRALCEAWKPEGVYAIYRIGSLGVLNVSCLRVYVYINESVNVNVYILLRTLGDASLTARLALGDGRGHVKIMEKQGETCTEAFHCMNFFSLQVSKLREDGGRVKALASFQQKLLVGLSAGASRSALPVVRCVAGQGVAT